MAKATFKGFAGLFRGLWFRVCEAHIPIVAKVGPATLNDRTIFRASKCIRKRLCTRNVKDSRPKHHHPNSHLDPSLLALSKGSRTTIQATKKRLLGSRLPSVKLSLVASLFFAECACL